MVMKLIHIMFTAAMLQVTHSIAAADEYRLTCVGPASEVVHVLCADDHVCECPEGYTEVTGPKSASPS